MDELLARHRKEQRELQGRITQKKKNATKKTRKGVNDECDTLERELKERQQREINTLNGNNVEEDLNQLNLDESPRNNGSPVSNVDSGSRVVQTEKVNGDTHDPETQPDAKKPNRQKARLARRAAEQEAQAAAAAEEAANMPNQRDQEISAMKKELQKRGLTETFIQPDGHCLFSACAHSMDAALVKESGPYSKPYQNVRYATADLMAKHPDDFSAFMEEPLDSYVKKIKDTAEWGGQLELQAIAKSYKINVNVLQADGRVEKFQPEEASEESDGTDIWLAYYRHSFGLGEHYNALRKSDKT